MPKYLPTFLFAEKCVTTRIKMIRVPKTERIRICYM